MWCISFNGFNTFERISFQFYDIDNQWPYHILGRNALNVTENDEVFTIGTNNNGLIGFGYKNAINEPFLVSELCYKKIIGFDNGLKHMIAITDENEIYFWGESNGFLPQMPEELRSERIFYICSGDLHSMLLSENGIVYCEMVTILLDK